jgi:hypothetical protein
MSITSTIIKTMDKYTTECNHIEYSRTTIDSVIGIYFKQLIDNFSLRSVDYKWANDYTFVLSFVANDNPTVVKTLDYSFPYLAGDTEHNTDTDYDRAMKGI